MSHTFSRLRQEQLGDGEIGRVVSLFTTAGGNAGTVRTNIDRYQEDQMKGLRAFANGHPAAGPTNATDTDTNTPQRFEEMQD